MYIKGHTDGGCTLLAGTGIDRCQIDLSLCKQLGNIHQESGTVIGVHCDIRCKQLQLDWEKQKRSYEREIEDTRKKLEDLKKSSELKEITAPLSGYVVYALKYMPGSKLQDGDYICTILTSDDFYVQTARSSPTSPTSQASSSS